MIRENGLENSVNLTINTEMRTALWESLGENITYQKKLISADQADEKNYGRRLNRCCRNTIYLRRIEAAMLMRIR